MNIRFLGTAAAEGMPAVFCNCAACKRAKEAGGKNIRTRSQILVGEDLLLDFPPDTYFHAIVNQLDLSRVKNLFITHAHPDHCSPTEFILRGEPYAHAMTEPILNVFASSTVLERIETVIGAEFKPAARATVRTTTLVPYQKITLSNGITVTALPAEHTKGEDCFIYLIEDGKVSFLQFNDSGILPDAVYEYLSSQHVRLHAVAFDCTYGYFLKGAGRHMGFLDTLGEKTRMEQFGLLAENCRLILTHFSHNMGLLYDEMQAKVKNAGFLVAYDGMELVV